jgi:hypothetical protein
LSDVERRYSQVEKEALGVVVRLCERAAIYLIGLNGGVFKLIDYVRVLAEVQRYTPHSTTGVPFTITAVRGSMITATRGDREVTRNSSAFKLFRQKEIEDPGARAQGESMSPESSTSKRREEAAPASSGQLDQALEASNQLHETSDEPQRVEQAMPQASVQQASKKRGRPTAEESERRRKEREAALAARRAEMPPVRRSERRTCTRSSSK